MTFEELEEKVHSDKFELYEKGILNCFVTNVLWLEAKGDWFIDYYQTQQQTSGTY